MTSSVAAEARTLLFVPGDRPDRFEKAASSGADLVVLDLEDGVAVGAKDRARTEVVRWLRSRRAPAAVRINSPGTPWYSDDLDGLAELPDVPVMLPKAEDPATVEQVAAGRSRDAGVITLLETAPGVLAAERIAAVPGVLRLALGTYDLAAELGVDPDDPEAMAWARGGLVLASAAARLVGPVDGITGDVRDERRLRADARRAARLGFGGKLCIHPSQVGATAAAFAPGEEELAWAGRVVRAAEAGGDGVLLVDGQMVDRPVVDRARRMLGRSESTPRPPPTPTRPEETDEHLDH